MILEVEIILILNILYNLDRYRISYYSFDSELILNENESDYLTFDLTTPEELAVTLIFH